MAATGQIPKGADGKYDIEAVSAALASNLDPARSKVVNAPTVNGERPMVNDPGLFACLESLDDLSDQKAVALGLILAHKIGASMANMAIAAGAPIRVAFALKDLATVAFNCDFEDALEALGIATDAITYRPDRMDDLDWAGRARALGEPVDPAGWAAWAKDRNRLMNEAADA